MTHVTVVVLDEDMCGIGGWSGAPPAVGDRVRVSKQGEGCAEPVDQCGTVVAREWHDKTVYPDGTWHKAVTCYVFVDWESGV